MKPYDAEHVFNVALVSHGGAGKTSLVEAMLYRSGAITRLGSIEEGNTTSDFDPDEVKRKISINAALVPCEWKDHKINLIDAPGYADFIGEAVGGLAAADTAIAPDRHDAVDVALHFGGDLAAGEARADVHRQMLA